MNSFQRIHRLIRLIWVVGGLSFLAWMIFSYQSRDIDAAMLTSDANVTIERTGSVDIFMPTNEPNEVGMIFYAGSMVDPKAYFPLLKKIAAEGYPVYLHHLPYRTAPFASHIEQLFQATLKTIEQPNRPTNWVIGGHSKGGALATQFVHTYPQSVDGLFLIATTHPKEEEFNLSTITLPTLKIYASNDGLATPEEIQQNSRLLPADTEYVAIEGGNHSQFGYYGKQLGDDNATITREDQQAQTLSILLRFMEQVAFLGQ